MTLVKIDIKNVASETHPDDRVVFYSPTLREAPGGGITSTAETVVPLVDGVGEKELAPGPVTVTFQCRGIADTRPKSGTVPEDGPASIEDVIAGAFEYAPPVVNRGLDLIEDARDEALADLAASAELVGAVLKEQGDWESGKEYPVGSVVTHNEKRWYGAASIQDVPDRINLLHDPKMERTGQWTKFSGVSTEVSDGAMSVTLSSQRVANNGVIQSQQDFTAPSGESLAAAMMVHNPGDAEVTARLWLTADLQGVFEPSIPGANVAGKSVTIPAKSSARVSVIAVMPEGYSSMKLRLSAGEATLPAGTVLRVSQAIVEESTQLGAYFDGDTAGASLLGEPYLSGAFMPAHRTSSPPSGEPGESDSWVLLSVLLDDDTFPTITDAGMWVAGDAYRAGDVVTHDGARWLGSSVSRDYPERTNAALDPKISDDTAWTAYSGVDLTTGHGAEVILSALRPGGNGLIVGSANYQIPVVPGDPISAGIRVENRGTNPVVVRTGFVFHPGATPSQGTDVTIPAGATVRVTYSGVVPAGHTHARLALFAGAGGVPAGTSLIVSQAIVEHAATVGEYFDGDSPGAQWVPARYGAASYSPARHESGPPVGEPGADPSWVLISSWVDGIDEIVAKLDILDTSVQEASQARTDAVTASDTATAQASASLEARIAAETASSAALNTRGVIENAAATVQANRAHVDAQVAAIDTAFTESVPPYLTKPTLDESYASADAVADISARTAPQKMLFELPVPKPHRAPNMAITRMLPDSTADIQAIFTEGDTVWGTARDRSLYKSTAAGHWEHKAYLSSGVAPRGGMVRCADNSLLHFDTSYRIRRSTNEGSSWTIVHERRAPGLEPLTTQSILVQPGTGHIYYGEYTNGTGPETVDCALWRSMDHGVTWEIFYTWPLLGRSDDPGVIRHIHSVQVDPYTSEVYVMLGDSTDKTGIWKVQGDTCVPVLTNDMLGAGWLDAPRCIGMMFFQDWIAWGSDSTSNPYIFRIPRTALGSDPSQLQRGPRLSSTAWGVARASEDGSRWALFASDEAYPDYAADRMAHIYAVEDQGATIYEVGALPPRATSGVTTLQPMAQPEKYGLEFAFNMRSGSSVNYASWRARLGYGAQTLLWPTQPKQILTQSQSSGYVSLAGAESKIFGGTRVPVYAKTLAIYDSSVMQQTGTAGNFLLQVVVDGTVVWSSAQASSRAQGRREFGGPVALIPLTANVGVEFRATNLHAANSIAGATTITFGWVE